MFSEEELREIQDILKLYYEAKSYILDAETFSTKGSATLAYELRNSYDHFLRAIRYKIEEADGKKVAEALSGAKKHIVRTFFDAIEMHFLNIKAEIIDYDNKYSFNVMILAMPDYLESIRPKVDNLSNEFEKLKKEKEIESFDVEEFLNKSKDYLAESKEISNLIHSKRKTLIGLKRENKKKKYWEIIINGLISLTMAILGFILGYFIK